jgi:hypothetical protein
VSFQRDEGKSSAIQLEQREELGLPASVEILEYEVKVIVEHGMHPIVEVKQEEHTPSSDLKTVILNQQNDQVRNLVVSPLHSKVHILERSQVLNRADSQRRNRVRILQCSRLLSQALPASRAVGPWCAPSHWH